MNNPEQFKGDGFTATRVKDGWLLEYKAVLKEKRYNSEQSECFRNEYFEIYRGKNDYKLNWYGKEQVQLSVPFPQRIKLVAQEEAVRQK